jgi:hypothetical protein
MDKRTNNGGHKTAGRKPKADEQKLIERLTPLADKAYSALEKALSKGDSWAVKMWFEYNYGKPNQLIETNDLTEKPITSIVRHIVKVK